MSTYSDKIDSQHFYNVLLLAAVVQTIAVDTSICERGFSLMNNLKTCRALVGSTVLAAWATIPVSPVQPKSTVPPPVQLVSCAGPGERCGLRNALYVKGAAENLSFVRIKDTRVADSGLSEYRGTSCTRVVLCSRV